MIITSLNDTDLYVFTMLGYALHNYPDIPVEYSFKCRTPNFDFSPFYARIQMEIDSLHALRFTDNDVSSLARLNLFQQDVLQFVKNYEMSPSEHISMELKDSGKNLVIRIKGRWVDTIFYETPLLAIISEVCQQEVDLAIGWKNLFEKTALLRANPLLLFEFGTRRRQSKYWQQMVFETLRAANVMAGTSNVELGSMYGVPVVGTVAHQFYEVMQVVAPRLEDFLLFSMKEWKKEYPTECRSMLTDIVGYKAFLKALNKEMSFHYLSYRQDSGNPYEVADAHIVRLKELEVNPLTRRIMFSNALSVPEAIKLNNHYKDQIGVNLAIGTGLTNDFSPQQKALSMVIKMVTCDSKPVAKLSDDTGKAMCEDENYSKMLGEMFPR